MNNPRQMAQAVARHGRHGDQTLVHVSNAELKGLQALHPLGRLPSNPQTGLPEAFGLGDILGLIGGIGGVLAAPFTGGMSLALTGALGSGLGSFAGDMIEGKRADNALLHGLTSGLMGYGLGSAGGLLSDFAEPAVSAATAGSGVGSAVGSDLGGWGAGAAGSSSVNSVGDLLSSGATGASEAAGGIGAAGLNAPAWATEAGARSIGQSALDQTSGIGFTPGGGSVGGLDALANRGMKAAGNLTNPDALWNTFGTNASKTTLPIAAGLYGQSYLGGDQQNYGPPPIQHSYPQVPGPNQRKYTPTPPGWDYSTGKEWNYFSPAFASGGGIDMATPAERARMAQSGALFPDMMMGGMGGGMGSSSMTSTINGQEDISKLSPAQLVARVFGITQAPPPKGFSDGGDVEDNYGDMLEQMSMANAQRRMTQNIGRYATMQQLQRNDIQMDRDGAAARNRRAGDNMRDDMSPEEILQEQVMAQQMQQRYNQFNQNYRPAPGGVTGYAMGGPVHGPGSGLDDAIPAVINGRQPAKLSSGEYVVPAHAVSALGNGSSEDGVRQLDHMVDGVMMQKFGSTNRKPRPINPQQALGLGGASHGAPFRGAKGFDEGGGVWDRTMRAVGLRADPPFRDPQSSWDIDPLPSEYPTIGDAQAARLYAIKYGDPNTRIIDNDYKMSQLAIKGQPLINALGEGDFPKQQEYAFSNPPTPTRLGWDSADRMQQAQEAARLSPTAQLGFDPSQATYTPNNARVSWLGATDFSNTKRMWFDNRSETTPVHESLHRGHALMMDDPEGREILKKVYSKYEDPEERLVRAEMQRRFNPDVEDPHGQYWGKTTDKWENPILRVRTDLSNQEFRKYLKQLDKVAHRMGAERLLAKEGGVH